ncbi:phosphoric ester hydrolase [Ascochyta rabiei]|uniref:Phosphoric ester hydrolase n=1 Tax=Didymella rabiei TaxID=5454 RepID=A0A162XMR4_DIDRA|nr:phosphoric ester hydrolase [Ascochyta rabiei]
MGAVLPYRDINVHSSSSHYAFSSPSSPTAPTLVVERPSGDIRLHDGKLLGSKRVSSVAGILGIIKLRLDKYIIVITKAQPMGRIKGHMIYKVVATEFLPLRERPLHDPDEDNYLSLLKTLIKTSPLFFSYSFDITNTFQRQAHLDPSLPLWKRADDRFFWNRFVSSDLIDFRGGLSTGYGRHSSGQSPDVDPYILPVMYGMMEIKNTSIKGTPLTFILITRRSRLKAGTRYFSRGIDENGNVSNFNETEQAIILNDNASGGPGGFGSNQNGATGAQTGKETQVLAYVQTRGSVPVYWAEINTLKYTPKLQIRLYGDNWLVNLVNQKGREQRVKEAYEEMVNHLLTAPNENVEGDKITEEKFHIVEPANAQTVWDRIHYVYFDFHTETKGLRWDRAKLLMDQLEPHVLKHGYFRAVDMPGDGSRVEVRRHQTAVSMIGRFILSRMLIDIGLMHEGESAEEDKAFEFLFRNVWADNADVVSKSYSDLNNSITRYCLNNFSDGPRQDAFDLPLFIQSIPYLLAASIFLIFVGSFTRRAPDAAVWPLRLLLVLSLATAGACLNFMWTNGTLYVNWPKLNRLPHQVEAYQSSLAKVSHNPVVGSLVGTKHERGKSDARLLGLEEGKKRVE